MEEVVESGICWKLLHLEVAAWHVERAEGEHSTLRGGLPEDCTHGKSSTQAGTPQGTGPNGLPVGIRGLEAAQAIRHGV
jgi:hypothetical protein